LAYLKHLSFKIKTIGVFPVSKGIETTNHVKEKEKNENEEGIINLIGDGYGIYYDRMRRQ